MDNKKMKLQTAGSMVLYILSAVMLFLDWFSLRLGTLRLSLLEVKDNFSFISDSAGTYITIALILAGVAILVAIVGAVEKKRIYGIGAPVITGAMLIAALIICSKAENWVKPTAAPFLALVFAVAGLFLIPTVAPEQTAAQSGRTGGVLVAVSGDYAGAEFGLSDGETLVLGRDPAMCSIVFEDHNISRQHCAIRYSAAEKMYYVTDLSSNGTFLEDGIRLQPQTETAVERGEKIYLSNQKDVFCLS